MTPKKVERKSDKGEKKAKPEKKAAPMKHSDERFLLIELSCKDMKCSPCTYPNCQRFVRELPKKKPFETRMTKTFEVRKPVVKPEDTKEKLVLIELSCKDTKCSPCTYPNCQRFAKTTLQSMRKKAPFKVKVTELKKGEDVKALLKKEAKA
jgi:hypothetical protein